MGINCPRCQHENPEDSVYCAKCASPLEPSSDFSVTKTLETPRERLSIGTTFAGRYRIEGELGKGGMGTVYRVHDSEIKEEVALKILKAEIASDEHIIERFRNELKIARRISHKHVCRMFDIGKEDEKYFITMEYVEGQDLKSHIRQKEKLLIKEAVNVAQQICEGLTEAHRLGVVHRDLKPQNIMIDKEGSAKIMDFGIARSVEAPGVTEAGMIIGTPDYISPEQAEGQKADQRSDIYSLGVILYEMVTGDVPFKGDTALSVALKHKSQLPLNPNKLNPDVSDDLSRLILICMEKDRARRYQSAEALLDDLRNIEEGFPLGTKIQPRRETFVQTLRRKRLLIPASAALLAIIAIAIWQLLPKKAAGPNVASGKPSLAVMYFENNTGDERLDIWRKMLADCLITDLSQSKYISVLSGDRLYEILDRLDQLETKTYSADVLNEVARQGNAAFILSGKYAKIGGIFRIDVLIQEAAKGEIIASERVEARGEDEVFPQVDELTRRIKTTLNLSVTEIADDIDREVRQITTPFPEAYRYYLEGKDYHNKGDLPNAVQSYEKALAIDPDYALVYIALADVYQQPSYFFGKNKEYAQKALQLSDRLSDRERLLAQGAFNSASEESWDEALDAYNQLLKLYPADLIGNKNLGELYFQMERWDEAIERFLICKEKRDDSYSTYTQAADAYAAKGSYDKAEDMLTYCLENFPDNSRIHVALMFIYLHQGKYDLATHEIDMACPPDKEEDENSFWRGHVYLLQGDLARAEKEYLRLLAKAENQNVRRLLYAVYLTRGKISDSVHQFEKALESSKTALSKSFWLLGLSITHARLGSPKKAVEECEKGWVNAVEADNLRLQRYALHIKGLVYLGVESIDQALEAADELKGLIEKSPKRKEIRLYYDLMGMIELEKKNLSGAIEYLKKAVILLPSQSMTEGAIPLFMDHLAKAYFEAGDIDEARRAYENIAALTTGRYLYGDIYVKSFYMLGKLAEHKGDKAPARENYQKFLDLWKDADPGIPEVEDAKSRLAAL